MMKWRSKWDYIDIGEIKIISTFLLFPKCINGEWRWLEQAMYMQECVKEMNCGSMDYNYHKEWRDIKWMNKKGDG